MLKVHNVYYIHWINTCFSCIYLANEKSVSLFKSPEVRIYEGHEREVFVLSWNPQFHLLATGSGDGTVRIWSVPLSSSDPVIKAPIVLVHETVSKGVKDVTTIAWHVNKSFFLKK